MRVLYFTNKNVQDLDVVPGIIKRTGDEVLVHTTRIEADFLSQNRIDFIVSDRPTFLIREPILTNYYGKIVNLHPSYLPYGKGYHPNFWSIVKDFPKGNTIHFIDEGIDTGDIIVQEEIFFTDEDTLSTSYYKLREGMVKLFEKNWPAIREQKLPRHEQVKGAGNLHYKKDFEPVEHLLTDGWNTKIGTIKKAYQQFKANH